LARAGTIPGSSLPSALPGEEPVPDFPSGLLVELSGNQETARLSSAVSAVLRAQRQAETTAWIQPWRGTLYPPDLADAGVDLEALVVVRVPESAGDAGLGKAAEMLVRSGAFGLVVVDARDCRLRLPSAGQGRLLGAVRGNDSCIVFLTSKSSTSESVGSLVGLRLEPRRVRFAPGLFAVEHQVLKNKPGLPYAEASERRSGPAGLR
jgi:recombination protein RecA